MSAELAQTPEAARAKAAATIKAREDGIRANAIRQGMEQERRAQEHKQAELQAAHAGEIVGIKQAHTEEIARLDERWAREERKHGRAKLGEGISTGIMIMLAIGSVIAAIYTTQIMNASFDAARESRVQDDVLRTLQSPPTTNEPRSQSADDLQN